MARKLDSMLIIDVESTCWESNPPPDQFMEIIEVGICLLDLKNLSLKKEESIIVLPKYSTISDFCTKLTGWTQKEINKKGIPFSKACSIIKSKYKPFDRTWASYGDYDRVQFDKDCDRKKVRNPFGRSHINIKNLLPVFFGLPKELGMETALELLGLELEGRHHSGADDAYNIGKILREIISKVKIVGFKT